VARETLKAVIKAIFTTSEQLMISALEKALKNEDFASHLNDGIIRYLYAAALLSFAGKEIDRENLAAAIGSLGISPDYKFIDIVMAANLKGHLTYVYAYYYLLVNGVAVSEQKLIETVESLGIKADRHAAEEVLKFVQQ
jgi:ribosomal protein L12E/L44/L45/RPP1/RPP2